MKDETPIVPVSQIRDATSSALKKLDLDPKYEEAVFERIRTRIAAARRLIELHGATSWQFDSLVLDAYEEVIPGA